MSTATSTPAKEDAQSTDQTAEHGFDKEGKATKKQIRGSSLLLIGRILSKGVGFAVQVLTVRYLAKADYGAFAYALSVVAMGETFATFGLDRAVTRFLPIYHEQRDYSKMFGTLVMVLSTVITLGLGMIVAFYGLQDFIGQNFISDDTALALLLILIFLAPVQALDTLLNGLFAVFSRPTAIFFRKYVLGPVLKLSVVLLLIFGNSGVRFLAAGYLAAGVIAVAIFSVVLYHVLKDLDLFEHFSLATIRFPVREVLSFTVPLLTSDLVYVFMGSVDAILLEYFQGTVDVASLRAVQPVAKLNQIVLASFGLLFTPAAARMFARSDTRGINNLYWQNAVWIAVASFPIFAVTFSLAQPVTVLLFEERYATSGIILALLAVGYYYNAALGQNGLTLKVFGKVRFIMVINILAAVLNVVLNVLLIPSYGALGAAMGTFFTLMIFNTAKQLGLRLGTNISLLDRKYLRVYASIGLAALGLWVAQTAFTLSVIVSGALAALVSVAIVRLNRDLLDVSNTFPELLRLPFAEFLFGESKPKESG